MDDSDKYAEVNAEELRTSNDANTVGVDVY